MVEEVKNEKMSEKETETKPADLDMKVEEAKAGDAEKKKKAKKIKKQVFKGRATIKCSYNNTMVSVADLNGNLLAWATSGLLGFKGAKKATPYAATQVVANVAEKIRKFGMKELEVFVRGVGSGRESSIRALANNGFDLILIKDVTPIPHNGCRPKKPRRV
jgi:small subunit ribosomal protein S11